MKKFLLKSFLLMLPVLSLQSCSPTVSLPQAKEFITVLDYTKYNGQGFFITESNSVNFDYDPIATIYISMYEGASEKSPNSSGWYVDKDGYSRKHKYQDWNLPSASEILEKAVEAAKKKGADAIINFNLSTTSYYPYSTSDFRLSGLAVTGMAVKRK